VLITTRFTYPQLLHIHSPTHPNYRIGRMYIPRPLLSSAYAHLKAYAHSTNPSILLLCALDTDSLCAARILTHLLKQDYIPHKIHPVAGYQELENVNKTLIRGNEELRFVICLGLGGLIDIAAFLDLSGGEGEEGEGSRRVECWLVDGRRPWNLHNVFGGGGGGEGGKEVEGRGTNGKVKGGRYGIGEGVSGVKCFDDGDIEEELEGEGVAFRALIDMPEIDEDSSDDSDDDEEEEEEEEGEEIEIGEESEDEDESGGVRVQLSVGSGAGPASGRKRKSSEQPGGSSDHEGESDIEISRVRRRRTGSNLVCHLLLN